MSNYTITRSPSTVSTAVGILFLGCAVNSLQARVETMDKVYDRIALSTSSSTLTSTYGYGSTFHVNFQEAGVVDASAMLHEASLDFVHGLSSGIDTLGGEFAEVLEDNFWDLVLR